MINKEAKLNFGILFAFAFFIINFLFIGVVDAVYIRNDFTGGDCGAIGVWNGDIKTCVLTADLKDFLVIAGNDITLDGGNHWLIGGGAGIGVSIDYWKNISVKNLKISDFDYGIYVSQSENNSITGNVVSNNFKTGIVLSNSHGNLVTENDISGNQTGLAVSYLYLMSDNRIYRNNFLNNDNQIFAFFDENDLFSQNPPIGGNYWSDYDTPTDGCSDLNDDNFCDSPYVFYDGQDNYPWTKQDGWKISQNQPPTFSNLNQYKSDGATQILEGGITTESSETSPTKSIAAFMATVSDPDNAQVKLQIELKQFNQLFNEQDLLESAFVISETEVFLKKDGLDNGQYHWRVRAVDDKGNTSQWQEFGTAGNVDFEVKLVPLYTQRQSPYPSETATDEWSKKPYGNGGISGFAEYPFSIVSGDNLTLVVNGEDDDAADGARTKLEAVFYEPLSGGLNNPLAIKTLSWPLGDNQYKSISTNFGFIPAGNYKLRLTSKTDYFDKNNPSDSGNLDVSLDWLEFRGTSGIILRKEAEDISRKLTGGIIESVDNKTVARIDGYNCGRTIENCGCLITSATMLLKYFSNPHQNDVTPLTLNEWLKANNGYSLSGNLDKNKVAEYASYQVKYDQFSSNNTSDNYNAVIDFINNQGLPVIARGARGRGGRNTEHFLVIDNALVNLQFFVKDPYWYNTKKLDEAATDNPNKIRDYDNHFDGLRIFKPGDGIAQSSLTIELGSPAELLLTDSFGRRLGKDPITGIEYNEIPKGSYLVENIDDATDESPIYSHDNKVAYIETPLDGQYDIKVIGTDTGNYSLDILIYDNQGGSQRQTFSGNTEQNLTTEYNLNYTPNQSENIIIEPIDNIPPEAKIFFDKDNKTLKIEGFDNSSKTSVQQLDDTYLIRDSYDNTSILTFNKLKQEGKEIKAELGTIRYDNQPVIKFPETELKYEWSLNKDQTTKELEQKMEVEDKFEIKAKYNHEKDETKIKIEIGEGKNKQETEQTLSGLVIIKLTTKSGNLGFEY